MQISRVLSNRLYCYLIAILVFSLIGWWQRQPAVAAVYQCKALKGSIVLTDKPKGFQGCILIQTYTPSPKVNGLQSSTPMRTQGGEEQDSPATPFAVPPPPHPSFPEGMQGNGPAGQSSASSEHDSAPCPPGINPLNPLSGGGCTPTTPETPATAHEP
ncbi:MAG TPA: hypothetical protein VJ805_02450 [Nitrospiraceae bacterium]|nr:hypothetical protein [Nitrospiraceae bacterium]